MSTAAPGSAELARLIAAHTAAVEFYAERLRDDSLGRARAYLSCRAIPLEVDLAEPWQIGYAPSDWTALTTHLRGRGFHEDELINAGLARRARSGRVIDVSATASCSRSGPPQATS